MRFGDDWRGVFFRGDDAIGYLVSLQTVIDALRARILALGPEGEGMQEGQQTSWEAELAVELGMLEDLATVLYTANQTDLTSQGWPPITPEGEVQGMLPFGEAVAPVLGPPEKAVVSPYEVYCLECAQRLGLPGAREELTVGGHLHTHCDGCGRVFAALEQAFNCRRG
jgi:hypothetical protein